MNDRKKTVHVGTVVLETVKDHLWLSLTILAVMAGAVGAALVPPLVLGRIVDGLTAGEGLTQLRSRVNECPCGIWPSPHWREGWNPPGRAR